MYRNKQFIPINTCTTSVKHTIYLCQILNTAIYISGSVVVYKCLNNDMEGACTKTKNQNQTVIST